MLIVESPYLGGHAESLWADERSLLEKDTEFTSRCVRSVAGDKHIDKTLLSGGVLNVVFIGETVDRCVAVKQALAWLPASDDWLAVPTCVEAETAALRLLGQR